MEKKIKVQELEIYVSTDGKEFDSQKECQEHEEHLNLLNSIKKKPIELFVYESTDGEQFTSQSDCLTHQKVINKVSFLKLIKQTCTSCKGEGEIRDYQMVGGTMEAWGRDAVKTFVGMKKCKACAGKGYYYHHFGKSAHPFTYDEVLNSIQ